MKQSMNIIIIAMSLDVDECAMETDNCDQICNNIFGGFTCSCYLGCQPNVDNNNLCTGMIINI